jgi:hypothetical protein
MSTMTSGDVKSILGIIQEKLAQRAKRSGIVLNVSSEASRQEDDLLIVVISPALPGVRAYDFVSTLGDVERELKEQGMQNVLLVPALTD